MIKPLEPDKLTKFIKSLRRLAKEVNDNGLDSIDIEDGEMAYMLNYAADLLENKE